MFELKRRVDIIAKKLKILPDNFSDRLMQFLSKLFPNHLPKRMDTLEIYMNTIDLEMSDGGINEARNYFSKF